MHGRNPEPEGVLIQESSEIVLTLILNDIWSEPWTTFINVAKSHYRDGFNNSDVEEVLSVFASEFTDMSEGRPGRYRTDAVVRLRAHLTNLFDTHEVRLNVIIIDIAVSAGRHTTRDGTN